MTNPDYMHQPVLLEEAVAALNVRADGCYVDATYGRGGHACAILQGLGTTGQLLALDRDPAAAAHARQRFGADSRFRLIQANFVELSRVLAAECADTAIAGILIDTGVSSPQLDTAERGFSFRFDGPLDMRMDPTSGVSAAEWLASVEEAELARVLKLYGEERFSRRIARVVVGARAERPIVRTTELAALVEQALPARSREAGKHPATRTFQAIRIVVNDELSALQSVLEQSVEALAGGGRLVVISFHSLEDRIVKRFLRREAKGHQLPPGVPVTAAESAAAANARLRLLGRALAGDAEIERNPRARSAVMRTAERLP